MANRSSALASLCILSSCAALLLTGCGAGTTTTAALSGASPVAGVALHGSTFGGQQPVSGAVIQLYAANATGYGLAATPLITSSITTNSGGAFSITSAYTCPSATAQVYLTATGGNPGLSANNPNLAMMAALGPCGSLTASTFIQMNEVTTVAAVYALAGFMTGPAKVSVSASNANGLALAFADVSLLVNNSTGALGGTTLPTGATIPTAEIDTLADILAACVNTTGGTAGGTNPCGKLFTAATPPGGTAPTDTLTAALNIAQNPGTNVAALYALSSPSAPFQPTLSTAPNDWTVAITYSAAGLSAPSSVAVDNGGNVWITNASANTVSKLTHAGAVVAGSPFAAGVTAPSSVAIDTAGGPWIAGKGSNTLAHLTAAGAIAATASGGGLSAPSSVAIDANNSVWAANSSANVVSEFNSAATATSATGYTGTGLNQPLGVAISPR